MNNLADPSSYLLGIVLAMLSGLSNSFGTVLQKKIVNEHRDDEEFMKNLVKNPTWLVGMIMQMAIGSIFFMTAQVFIGPALIPGLMSVGLIILALGSVKIVGESLKSTDIVGIALMILGTTLLGFSELSIEIAEHNLVEINFVIRMTIFTAILLVSALACIFLQKRVEKFQAIFFAIASGFMFSLTNFWISPLMGVIAQVFGGVASWGELIIFICSSVILVLAYMWGIKWIQDAFKYGQASNLIPIQQVPIQITPIFVYFVIFLLAAPYAHSFLYMFFGVGLIISSSFLLAKRQAQLEEITKD